MESSVDAGSVRGVIPNFFYDIIANIIPGGWLIIGSVWIWNGQHLKAQLICLLTNAHVSDFSGTAAAITVSLGFICILCAAALVGFLLSAVSYWIVERFLYLILRALFPVLFGSQSNGPVKTKARDVFTRNHRYSVEELSGIIGKSNMDLLKSRFKRAFGSEISSDNDIEWASFLCSYYIWQKSQNLGLITARFDAEKQATQSCILVSLILLIEHIVHNLLSPARSLGSVSEMWVWGAVLLAFSAASFASFSYHRKKRVYGRFQIFHALYGTDEKSK